MKRWGLLLMVLGALSFVLPLVGFQLQIFALFGEGAGAVALLAIGAGFVFFLLGSAKDRLASGGAEGASIEETSEPVGALREPPAASAAAGREAPRPAAQAGRGLGKALLVLIVLAAVAYGGYQALRSDDIPSTGFMSDGGGEPAATSAWSQHVVPTDAEMVELGDLLDRANRERSEAQIAGNQELAQRKAQEYQHCQTAMSHALKMRQAIVEMRAAEEAGDPDLAYSKYNIYLHYRGELYLMLPYVYEPLARLVRRWTD